MIGDRIKEARQKLGYSAEQVAAFLGVSPATVYRYENGDISKLPSKFIKPLADYLCVSPSYLMGWTEDHPEDPLSGRPRTFQARFLAQGVDTMPAELRDRIVNMMLSGYPEFFKGVKYDDENDT